MSLQLHRLPSYFHPSLPLQIISFHLLTCLCGGVKKSAVAPYSGDLMVRFLWTLSFWILCVHALVVPGPLWILVRQRVLSRSRQILFITRCILYAFLYKLAIVSYVHVHDLSLNQCHLELPVHVHLQYPDCTQTVKINYFSYSWSPP